MVAHDDVMLGRENSVASAGLCGNDPQLMIRFLPSIRTILAIAIMLMIWPASHVSTSTTSSIICRVRYVKHFGKLDQLKHFNHLNGCKC